MSHVHESKQTMTTMRCTVSPVSGSRGGSLHAAAAKRPRAGVACAVLCTAAIAMSIGIGCAHKPPPAPVAAPQAPIQPHSAPATHVDRGELFVVGSDVYDAYFQTVHTIHADLDMLTIEERSSRMPLAMALDLLPSAAKDQILSRLRQVAAKLPPIRVVIEGNDQTNARAQSVSGRPSSEMSRLMKAIDAAVGQELQLATRASLLPERAHRIRDMGATLASGAAKDLANAPAARREQMQAELAASLRLMDTVASSAELARDEYRAFVHSVADAVTRRTAP